MSKRSLQTMLLVACLAGVVYMAIVLERDGTLQNVWHTIKSGAFGGYPL